MLRWTARSAMCFLQQSQRAISTATPTTQEKVREELEKPSSETNEVNDRSHELKSEKKTEQPKANLVAAAFASLKKSTLTHKKQLTRVDEEIASARTPEALLTLAEVPGLTQKQIQTIVSLLAEWSVKGYVVMTDFESDPRFISLCRQLNRGSGDKISKDKISVPRTNDLSMVLGVTGEDEAAKLISSLTVPQMIKVLSSLATQKRRSTLLLRSLAFNIVNSTSKLDVKQGADILYALASLNFPNEVLLEKVCNDLLECVPQCKKTSVIGSISTSLGLLKYKDIALLDALSDWIIANKNICRLQEISSLIITLASVNHIPSNQEHFFQFALPLMKKEELPNPMAWLDVVWSLVVLENADHNHIQSVLQSGFLDWFVAASNGAISIPCKRKLLNINGVAKWTNGYDGPLLGDIHDLKSLPLVRTKEKQALVGTVLETLSNLLPSAVYLRPNVDTGMGFLLDGECLLDAKMTPLPVIDKKTGGPIAGKSQKGTRIAIMVWDYHDFTKGRSELCGSAVLCSKLLSKTGYKVLSVPFSEFNPRDKLTARVQYLEKELKSIVRPG